jgi:superfamily I DNA/RNA helicase
MSDSIDEENAGEFQPARFEIELGLPEADPQLLDEAATALRQEFRSSSKWKRLRCQKLSVFAERDRGTVYVIHVGRSVEFDWTWEGATAFRPRSMQDDGLDSNFSYENLAYEEETVWSGEIVEVDELNGCLFISLDSSDAAPVTGSFFVRPFEFLAVADSVFSDPQFESIQELLPARLAAAQGNIHPLVSNSKRSGLPVLGQLWRHSWSVVWGPPGTGKTYTTGQQIAAVLQDSDERILVVSTTNRATDAVAVSIGNAARSLKLTYLDEGYLLRLGKGAAVQTFAQAGLDGMLRGTESEALTKIDDLAKELRAVDTWEEKALTRKRLTELREQCGDQSNRLFIDPDVRAVVATSFKAMLFLQDPIVKLGIEQGTAPFTTIFIDEAGLMSRTTIAALSLLAARRVVLVGDSKQLAPISRISRILPTQQQTWLASSGLSHLGEIDAVPEAIHVLSEQRRMHADICSVVSKFQYGGFLTTAEDTRQRPSRLSPLIGNHSRAIWYVLDYEPGDLAEAGAQRGPGNRSWLRTLTSNVLEKLFEDPEIRTANGLFVSPFKAQAVAVSKMLSQLDIHSWESSTVHSQQGSEADIVIFDTVNAGSYNWPYDEWKRIVNVALSRAREAIIVLATRSEMDEPYLRPLTKSLTPSILIRDADGLQWKRFNATDQSQSVAEADGLYASQPNKQVQQTNCALGRQVASRKGLKPVLSKEQQRLTNIKLDGKPRLVRGVAGSGKSIVLCNWLAKTVHRHQAAKEIRVWAVYANRSLHKLLRESVESAWIALHSDYELFDPPEFPWSKVSLLHIKDLLAGILPSVALTMNDFDFDYDRAAEEFLNRQDSVQLLPRCNALFIDEAQDMGPATLKLLLSMVELTDNADPHSQSAHIFYDNEQNIYDRKTPNWSELGIDLRGRSVIMRESFRSTVPITEMAINVLDRLLPNANRHDRTEMLRLGLIEKTQRDGESWYRVRFNQIAGPIPTYHLFDSRKAEIDALFQHLKGLIVNELICASDICLIYNSQWVAEQLTMNLAPRLNEIGVELSVQTGRSFERRDNTLLVTTSHSFKGYESEVVIIPCVDQFVTAEQKILANNLYVAMTRARSLLSLYGIRAGSSASRQITQNIGRCIELLNQTPDIEIPSSIQDDLNDILEQIGVEHRNWLVELWKHYKIVQEPLYSSDGKLIAEPIFWFRAQEKRFACFGQLHLEPATQQRLALNEVCDLRPGQQVE